MSHAPFPPSSAHRWVRCPGSADVGFSSPDSVYSRQGTFAHAIAAKALDRELDASAFVGETDGEFVFSKEDAAAVQVYLDAVNGILMVEGGELKVERPVTFIERAVYGTADATIVVRGPHGSIARLYVIDLKFGSGMLVEAQDNEQLLIYALGTMAQEGAHPQNVAEVVTMIVQPRCGGGGAEPVRRATYTPAEMANWRIRLASAHQEASVPGGRRVPGEHCHFCPGKGTCHALRDEAMAVAVDLFPALDPTEKPKLPNVREYTPSQLARALEGADIVEQWLKTVRAEAFNRAKLGTKIPGMKLVESIGNRQWKNEADAAKTLAAYGIDPFERTLKSPAQVEKMSKAVKPAVASLTERRSRGVVLAPESDRRPEVVDPSSTFELLDESPQE